MNFLLHFLSFSKFFYNHLLREVYLIEDGEFEPSYMPNVTLKVFDGDIAPDSEAQTALNKYLERKSEA